jgi:hypothetical protein
MATAPFARLNRWQRIPIVDGRPTIHRPWAWHYGGRCSDVETDGEIAPHSRCGDCDLHNQTVTITVISEVAA